MMIAYRQWTRGTPQLFYVSDVKGSVGDWGYTTDASKALPLNPQQCLRFARDCRRIGYLAHFLPFTESN